MTQTQADEYTMDSGTAPAAAVITTAANTAVKEGMGLPYFVMLAIDAFVDARGNDEADLLDWDLLGHGVREAAAAAGITRLTE